MPTITHVIPSFYSFSPIKKVLEEKGYDLKFFDNRVQVTKADKPAATIYIERVVIWDRDLEQPFVDWAELFEKTHKTVTITIDCQYPVQEE